MNLKIALLLILVLILTGCSVEYNLSINDDLTSYSESINIDGENKEENESISNYAWPQSVYYDVTGPSEQPSDEKLTEKELAEYADGYYTISHLTYQNNPRLNFSYTFNKEGLNRSAAISTCYGMFSIINTNNKVRISTSNVVRCFNNYPSLSSLTINIDIGNNTLVKSNADKAAGNVYTWVLDKTNYKERIIQLELEKKETNISNTSTPEPPKEKNNTSTALIILIGFIGFAIALLIIIKIKGVMS